MNGEEMRDFLASLNDEELHKLDGHSESGMEFHTAYTEEITRRWLASCAGNGKDMAPVTQNRAQNLYKNGKYKFPESVEDQKILIKSLFKRIDLSTVTYIKVKKDFIEVYVEDIQGTMLMQKSIVVWISLKRAMIWLSEQGFVQANRFMAVNIQKAILVKNLKTIYINNEMSINVGRTHWKNVLKVFEEA
jgi:hypothetical protein